MLWLGEKELDVPLEIDDWLPFINPSNPSRPRA